MSFKNDEVPTWVINGVNKVFQLLNTPTQIIAINLDGADYINYTFVWNVITLSDAPIATITVDYFYGSVYIPVTSTVTLWDIISEVWFRLGQTSSSVTFNRTRVVGKINYIIRELCKGRYVSPLPQVKSINREYRCGKLWFMNGSYPIRIKAGSTLVSTFNVGDTTISCNTANLLSSWWIMMGGEIFSYSSITSSTLQGVSGLTIQHLATEKIVQLYEAPAEMSKPSSVTAVRHYSRLINAPIPYSDEWNLFLYFQLLRSWTTQLFNLYWMQNDDLVEVNYTKIVTDLVDDTDICILPEDYWMTVVAPIVSAELWLPKAMPNATGDMNEGVSKLQVMFGDFGNIETITKQKITPTSYRNIRSPNR